MQNTGCFTGKRVFFFPFFFKVQTKPYGPAVINADHTHQGASCPDSFLSDPTVH